ncbi:MAG TPA: response regulator, partial [Candidatus Kryptonia bacterium]|nr:response regulator [Candidatus Kryptonia bacterium]
AESEQAREQHAAAVRAATEQAQGHEAEWRSTRENLQRELDAAREESHNRRLSIEAVNTKVRVLESQLAERDTVRKALSERIVSLEEELRQRDVRLQHLSTQVAGHSEESKVWLETAAQREAELVAARDELAARLETERVHTVAAQDQVATLAARVSELEAESADTRDRLVAQLETERAQASAASQAAADVATRVRALESELDTAREQLAAQGEAERTQAANAANQAASFTATLRELEAELSRAREAATSRDTEWRAAHDTLARDLDDARAQLSAALAARDQAGAKLQLLEEQVAAREAALGDVRGQMETASAVSREKDESLLAAEQRAAELARHLEEVQEQTVGALQAQEAMTIRLTELDHERRELLIRIDQMTALTTQLERECERLRRDRPAGEETRKLKAEFARLEAKLKEVEQQQGEAAQRHSAAVGGYMVELNQRSEALHARNLELERVTEELNLTRQTCDDALAQIEIVRQERAEIEQQLKELRAAAAGAARAATPPAPERSAPMPARPATAKVAAPATPPPSVPPTSPFSRGTVARGPLTVIHLEENKAFREPLREVLEQLPQSSYLNAPEAPAGPGARMLAVNLLNRTHDALAAITTAVKTDAEHHEVFAYCADGSNGFLFGTVDFFSQPIDPDDCVTRMLERRGSVQRLLAVSDNVEMTGALREVLSRMRCSTSVAFDSRQAIDLLPMIKPEVVLVDFALPRGEGLRLVARLRSDPKTRDLPLAVLLPANANVAEFRQHALRAAREVTMEPKQLGQSLAERLGVVPETRAKGAGLLKTG